MVILTGMTTIPGNDAPISVGALNRRARQLLERGFDKLWVEGEVSNLARPASGHLYFSLKDADAQIRCAWFRQRQRNRADVLANGEQMLVFGRVSLYEPRGDYQLIVERVEPTGEGELRRRFERLKKKLDAEGLFDSGRKRALPTLPQQIGVVTSPSGAAIRDIISVLGRRFPAVPVVIYPAAVQGQNAAAELTAALSTAAQRAECDVLIVTRGGGSLEDLMAFNDETVARAIDASPIPVISAVGHEVDVTIADLVADRRAPTPSGAAEIAVPEQLEWQRELARASRRLASLMRRRLDDRAQALDWLSRRLAAMSPSKKLAQQKLQLNAVRRSLGAAARHDLVNRARHAEGLRARLFARSPQHRMRTLQLQNATLNRQLRIAGASAFTRLETRLDYTQRRLHAVGPLATLQRGYAIVTERASGKLLTDAAEVQPGTEVEARLASGRLAAKVTETGDDGATT